MNWNTVKRRLWMSVFFMLLFMWTAFPGTVAAADSDKRTVKVVLPDDNGQMDEMAKYTKTFLDKLSEYTNWNIQYISLNDTDSDDAIMNAMDMVKNCEADAVGSVLKNEMTEEMFVFPESSYGKMYTTLLTLDSSAVTKLTDSFVHKQLRVAVLGKAETRNNETISYLESSSFDYQLIEYNTEAEQLKALENGEADVMTSVSSENIPNTRVIEEYAPRYFYIAFAPNDQELADEYDAAVKSLTAMQPFYIDELAERYFNKVIYEYENVNISDEFLPEDQTIHVLGIDGDAPFFFLDEDKKPVGMLYNIINSFAEATGQKLEIDICSNAKERDDRMRKKEYDFVIGSAFTAETCQKYGFVESTSIITADLDKVYRNGYIEKNKPPIIAVVYGTKRAEQSGTSNVKIYGSVEEVIWAIEKKEADIAQIVSPCADFYVEKLDAVVDSMPVYDTTVDVTVAVNKNLSEKYIAFFNLYVKSITNGQLSEMMQEADQYANATPMQAFVKHHISLIVALAIIFISAIMLSVGLLIYIRMRAVRTALEKENRKNKHQLAHDPLTGVLNRQGYNEILEQYRENDAHSIVYIQLDIDNFKVLNDTYGHAFGDEVLKEVAEQLVDVFRADDYVFRFGGDEFAVLLNNCKADAWESIALKQRMIHSRMNQKFQKEIFVTISMGVSWSESGFSDDLVGIADDALYMMKKHGRGGCCVMNRDCNVIYEWKDEMGNNKETRIILQDEDSQHLIEAMNSLYFAAYYISLRDDKYYTFKTTDESRRLEAEEGLASVAVQNFVRALVTPQYRAAMGQFMNLQTLSERLKKEPFLEKEYLSAVQSKGWCRMRFLPVKKDEYGNVTHVQLLVASIDKLKRESIAREQHIRNVMKLQLRINEIVAKSMIIQSGFIDKQTGETNIWLNAVADNNGLTLEFEEMKNWGQQNLEPKEKNRFIRKFNLADIVEKVEKQGEYTMLFHRIEENGRKRIIKFHFETLFLDEQKLLMVIEAGNH